MPADSESTWTTAEREYLDVLLAGQLAGYRNGLTLIGSDYYDDYLEGDEGNNKLYGGTGNDQLFAFGMGNNYLEGGEGDDTYYWYQNTGNATINNYGGGDDKLDIACYSDLTDIYFSKNDNDLIINILGSSGSVTIANWFLGGEYMVNNIETFYGEYSLVNDQLDQLIQAMASFNLTSGSDYSSLTTAQQEQHQLLLANAWK